MKNRRTFLKKHNIVYITTNLINGRQYIGDHSTDNLNDGYLGSGKALIKAISKYGKENFKREILEECDTKLTAWRKQKEYISKYNTITPHGYNICPAGGPDPLSIMNDDKKFDAYINNLLNTTYSPDYYIPKIIKRHI